MPLEFTSSFQTREEVMTELFPGTLFENMGLNPNNEITATHYIDGKGLVTEKLVWIPGTGKWKTKQYRSFLMLWIII